MALDVLLLRHRKHAERIGEFRTWDLHFSGAQVLAPQAIASVAARIAAKLPALQTWILIDAVRAEIRRALPAAGEDHALLFHSVLESNRRPLSRFLRQLARGRDERLEHSANRRWLARIASGGGIRMEHWFDPPSMTFETEKLGAITLSVERDPFELLRIGTYAGSCLGLGGWNAHAAVAILLDANKRVVFARRANGKFVARQVVGVSDDCKLACFRVYGADAKEAPEDLFERYAREWSERLGIPLLTGEVDATKGVPPLAVKHWYDDGLWERMWVRSEPSGA